MEIKVWNHKHWDWITSVKSNQKKEINHKRPLLQQMFQHLILVITVKLDVKLLEYHKF
jgi:hypothetical protein